jgi:hypothetical protein
METQVHYRILKSSRWVKADTQHPDAQQHTATWREILAGHWEYLNEATTDKPSDPTQIEVRAWHALLENTSLIPHQRNLHDAQQRLRPPYLQRILSYTPPWIPRLLVTPLIESTLLTPEEEHRIKQECYTLWLGQGSTVNDPHPLLERAVSSMSQYERYGIPLYPTTQEVPLKLMRVMRLVSQNYSEVQGLNQRSNYNQEIAARQAGLRGADLQANPFKNHP